jgi:hypothetical protein
VLRRLYLALFLVFSFVATAHANNALQGFCEEGDRTVSISGLVSTTKVQQSFPACTVTVYLHGTVTLATIYSDNAVTPTPLANPFTASSTGLWQFYAADGNYDVVMSGAGFPSPFTLNNLYISSGNVFPNFGAKCDGTTNDAAALNAASVALNSAGGGTIIIPSGVTCVIGSNVTVAATVALQFQTGGKLSVSNAVTLTPNGPILASPTPIFTLVGSGVVVLTTNYKTPTTYPQWWGAACDGSTDDSTALQSAITASKSVTITANTTCNYATGLTLHDDLLISGGGSTSILQDTGVGIGLSASGNVNITIRDVAVSSSTDASGITISNSTAITVDNVYMDGSQSGHSTAGINIVGTGPANSAVIRVQNSRIQRSAGDGINISGNGAAAIVDITGNRIQANVGYGLDMPIGMTTPSDSVNVVGNDIEGNTNGAIYADSVFAFTIKGNHFENSAAQTSVLVNLGLNGSVAGADISNNDFAGVSASYCVQFAGSGGSVGLHFEGNIFTDCATAGIRFAGAAHSNITILSNQKGAGTAAIYTASNAVRLFAIDANGIAFVNSLSSGPSGPPTLLGGPLQIANGPAITNWVTGSATVTYSPLTSLNWGVANVTVTGSAAGDLCFVSTNPTLDSGLILTARVITGNTVQTTAFNQTGSPITPPAVTVQVTCIRNF